MWLRPLLLCPWNRMTFKLHRFKRPQCKRQQWRCAPISNSAGISRDRRWLEPNRSVWTPSGLPSELIVSIDPLSSLQQGPNSPPQSEVASTRYWWALSRRWAKNQCSVCSTQWRPDVGENSHLWASVTMWGLIERPHSLLKITTQHECRPCWPRTFSGV